MKVNKRREKVVKRSEKSQGSKADKVVKDDKYWANMKPSSLAPFI